MTSTDDSSPDPTPAAGHDASRRGFVRAGAGTAAAAAVSAAGIGAVRAQQGAAEPTGQLDGRVALVTGAAHGIGRAIAIAYAREGADVALFDIAGPIPEVNYPLGTVEELDETRALVEAEGRRCIAVRGDQRDGAAVRAAVDRAVEELGALDVMVANAGVTVWGRPIGELTEAEIRTVLDVNLLGTFHCIRAAIPHMSERGSGRIVTMSSMMGRRGMPAVAPYNASKWAIIGLTKSVALELAGAGIRVNCITPGAVETPLNLNEASYRWGAALGGEATREGYVAMLSGMSPTGVPWSQPEEVAHAAVYLAGPHTANVTGTVVTVDIGANAIANVA